MPEPHTENRPLRTAHERAVVDGLLDLVIDLREMQRSIDALVTRCTGPKAGNDRDDGKPDSRDRTRRTS